MSGFERLGDDEVIHRGQVVTLAVGRFRAPDGHEFDRELVRHPGAVSVVPLLDDGDTVVALRQFRAPVGGEILEIPAGKRDVHGEPPDLTAGRELEEEIGMRAGRLDELGQFYNSPGFCDEYSYVYLARDLERCATDAQGVEETHMTVEHFSLRELPALVAARRIVDAKTIIGCALALERLRSEGG